MEIHNFQGLELMFIEPNGENYIVRGNNGAGKSTIANAITWLFYDKPAEDIKNFSPKPWDKGKQQKHHVDSSVEMMLDNGRVLKKVFSENWTKKKVLMLKHSVVTTQNILLMVFLY